MIKDAFGLFDSWITTYCEFKRDQASIQRLSDYISSWQDEKQSSFGSNWFQEHQTLVRISAEKKITTGECGDPKGVSWPNTIITTEILLRSVVAGKWEWGGFGIRVSVGADTKP